MKRSLITLGLALLTLNVSHADIIISEYIEGSSFNKAVELYNTSDSSVDLSGYQLSFFFNGNTSAGTQIELSGTIEPGDTFVIADDGASTEILDKANLISNSSFFNGDDAVVLTLNGAVVDSLGQVGVDPGSEWVNNGVGTQNETLIRISSVSAGDTVENDAFDPSIEYTSLSQNDFSDLGMHTFDGGTDGPGDGELIAPCFNCPDLMPVADPDAFDAASFYASLNDAISAGETIEQLKVRLSALASQGQVDLTYSEVWSALTATDEDPNNTDNVILFYSGRSQGKFTNGSGEQSNDPDNWNREHSWPRSHGFPDDGFEAFTDIHHLRPTDISINSSRGNLDFDNSDNPLAESPINRIDSDSFEPRDAVKGDVARMMFYMDARYEGASDATPDLLLVNRVTDSSTPELGFLCTLLEWHQNDPVDATEVERHNRIYQYQGNRNPFVDNPGYVDAIYSLDTCADEPVDPIDPVDPVDPVPTGTPLILTAVVDGTLSGGVPKAVELYVAADIADLSSCGVGSANNGGGTDGQEFTFPAVAASKGDFIYVASESTGFNTYFGFAPDYTSGALAINGDDAVEVFCDGEVIDLYGDINVDGTGQPWEYKDSYALRNAETSADGSFDINNWTVLPPDTLDGVGTGEQIALGSFTLSQGALFFSEYIEGSSLNKAVEIVNTTGAPADLNGYLVEVYNNGASTPNSTEALVDVVAANDVLVIANPSAAQAILDETDVFSSAMTFNGDDAVVLRDPEGNVVDVIGQVGFDPGSRWGSGDFSTQNNTLRRAASVTSGDTEAFDAFDPALEWEGFGNNNFDDIGSYDFGDDDGGGALELGQCLVDEATLISDVQGVDMSSPLSGVQVVVEAVITSINTALGGFFIQEEITDEDADSATSEGLFVEFEGALDAVAVGDVIRVLGEAGESSGKTRLTASEISEVCGQDSVSIAQLSLPFADGFDLESVENMLVENSQDLVVSDIADYPRFGEITVSSDLIYSTTQLFVPGSQEAADYEDEVSRNGILLDNLTNGFYSEIPDNFGGELSTANPLRIGSTVFAGNTFVMDFAFSNFRLRPISGLSTMTEARPAFTPVEGNLTVASFNVLNLFNGDGNGGDFPTPRGADTVAEYELQLEKIVAAFTEMDADVLGLIELENDGYGDDSAIAQLVDAINLAYGSEEYAFISAGAPQGTDVISVGILYKSSIVSPEGELKVLTEANSIVDEDGPLFVTDRRNRPAFAQLFTHLETGSELVVNVNHLKSKGGSCGEGDDSTNGQGACNLTRLRASIAINAWLNQEFPEKATLVIGDLNAYAQEDPIINFAQDGFTNVAEQELGVEAFSYRFRGAMGTLDYILANDLALETVTGITKWSINASESRVFDYNENLPNSSQLKPAQYVDNSAYRSSDHDPVVVALTLVPPPVPGDVDGDGVLTREDYFILIRALNTSVGDADFNPAADLNEDGSVDVDDARIIRNLLREAFTQRPRGLARGR